MLSERLCAGHGAECLSDRGLHGSAPHKRRLPITAASGPGRLGPDPLDEAPLAMFARHHAWSAKSCATSCSPAAVR